MVARYVSTEQRIEPLEEEVVVVDSVLVAAEAEASVEVREERNITGKGAD